MIVDYFQYLGEREVQEDSLYVSDDFNFFVVCDGIGSSEGKFASTFLVSKLKKMYDEYPKPFSEISFKNFIHEGITELGNFIDFKSGTTLVTLYLKGTIAYFTHIGDSKLYFWSNNIFYSTRDHSVVQDLFECGVIETENQMKSHPLKNRITKAITSDTHYDQNFIEINSFYGIEKNDVFVLCSDGVIENFTNQEFNEYIASSAPEYHNRIKQLELERAKHSIDNSSLIFIQI
ncbi:MAG TPA: protein phosphatase 2C domain-containing protein [Saprospiraceae bacterium]|nr:protein phosphatase 2C domain-containing protein [Saprospiraceae bacterium]